MDSVIGYLDKNTIVHKLNPIVKLIGTILLVTIIFFPFGFFLELILFIFFSIIWYFTKLPKSSVYSILSTVCIMFPLILIINFIAFKSPSFNIIDPSKFIFNLYEYKTIDVNGQTIYYNSDLVFGMKNIEQLQIFTCTANNYNSAYHLLMDTFKESHTWSNPKFSIELFSRSGNQYTFLYIPYEINWYTTNLKTFIYAFFISFKITLIIMLITILISSTTIIELSYAINKILSPLKIFKFPCNEISMVISIALRFIPSLLEEAKKIMRAQASRGLDFANGKFLDKINAFVSLIVPLFIVSFQKSADLSNAMDSRGYNPKLSRTCYRNYNIKTFDFIYIFFCFFIFIFFLYLTIKSYKIALFGIIDTIIA